MIQFQEALYIPVYKASFYREDCHRECFRAMMKSSASLRILPEEGKGGMA